MFPFGAYLLDLTPVIYSVGVLSGVGKLKACRESNSYLLLSSKYEANLKLTELLTISSPIYNFVVSSKNHSEESTIFGQKSEIK